jgi:hypothetical protein
MTQKFLYIVDHFAPFPTSEYGGLWNVIASNDEECFDLIVEADQGWNTGHYANLRENIQKSQYFALSEDLESCVVESFTT